MIDSSFFAKLEGIALFEETSATTRQLDEACEVFQRRRWAENCRIVGTGSSFVNPFLPNPVGALSYHLGHTHSYNRLHVFWVVLIFSCRVYRMQLYR